MEEVYILYLRDAAALYGEGIAYATPDSAGMDLRACIEAESLVIEPGQRAPVPSGICIEPRVPGVAGFIYSRSGLGAVKGLTVAQGVGVIDADYRGELVVCSIRLTAPLPRAVATAWPSLSSSLCAALNPRPWMRFPRRSAAAAASAIRAGAEEFPCFLPFLSPCPRHGMSPTRLSASAFGTSTA